MNIVLCDYFWSWELETNKQSSSTICCVILKQSFDFFPTYVLGYKRVWKIKHKQIQNLELGIQALDALPILSYPMSYYFFLISVSPT